MSRQPLAVIPARKAEPAPGLIVDRPFPGREIDFVDPWLMLDHFGPDPVAPGDAGGLNPHPHRGFETVTLIFDGTLEHHDSSGGHGLIRPGGVQWMTAGAGIVHAEYREKSFVERGGSLHGVQLWLNLPRANKRATPGYQDLPAEVIPVVENEVSRVRVIAGTYRDATGPAKSFTPVTLLHVTLNANGTAKIDLPEGHNALVYAVSGDAEVGQTRVRGRHMALLPRSGGDLRVPTAPASRTGPPNRGCARSSAYRGASPRSIRGCRRSSARVRRCRPPAPGAIANRKSIRTPRGITVTGRARRGLPMSELGLYVVRVYRRDSRGVAGIIEDVATGARTRFRTPDVLWQVLEAPPPCRHEFPTNASEEEEP